MKRQPFNAAESLELLLDAICNTFGAVIFIAMLVAVLASRSADSQDTSAPTDTAAGIAATKVDIQKAQEQIRVLSQLLEQQTEIADRFASNESIALATQIKQQTATRVELMREKTDIVASTNQLDGRRAQLQQTLNAQRSALQSATSTNSKLKKELKKQTLASSRTARIPRLRQTSKRSLVYAIDDGRLVQVTDQFTRINESECTQTKDRGRVVICPTPGRGLRVSADTAPQQISHKFDEVHGDTHFVQLFVSRDSFGEFLPVKDALVERSIDYEVIITDGSKVELYLGESQRKSFVQ